MPSNNLDTQENRRRVNGWMRQHSKECDNSTSLSEQCADALNLYENQFDYTIPEFIFEIALSHIPGQ